MSPDRRPRRGLAALWRDCRGVSAVEFALIAPVLILFYCGMTELTGAIMAQRRLSHLASSVGDVVARESQLSNADLTNVFAVSKVLMAPFPTTALRMCLLSVVSDATGKDTVEWSEPSNTPDDCPAATTVLPATEIPIGALQPNKSVIVSKASYTYTSPVSARKLTFRRTFYLQPRGSDKVVRVP